MDSAIKIRNYAKIILYVNIACVVIAGIALILIGYDFYPILGIALMAGGSIGALMQNALFLGFADLIDNSYVAAYKRGGAEVPPGVVPSSGNVDKEKLEYADELLAKGLISTDDRDNIAKGK